jgi:hypothetical protein
MKAQNALSKHIADLILADHETGGHPVLPKSSRDDLIQILTRILINWDAMHTYIRALGKNSFRHSELLPEEQAEALITRGPEALDDASLAALLLNPVALYDLYDQLDERLPEAWLEAMEQDGRAVLQEHGREQFVVEDLTGSDRTGKVREPVGAGRLAHTPEPRPPAARRFAWEFIVPPDTCEWNAGDPAAVSESTGRVIAEWSDEGYLDVAAEGFLSLGLDYTLEVEWRSAGNEVRGQGKSENDFVPVRLQPPDRQPPRAGDRFHLRHVWRPEGSEDAGWDVQFVVTVPPDTQQPR